MTFFPLENSAVYETMWKTFVEPDRLQITKWRTRTACLITKAADTYSAHAIHTAFPLQQLFHERAAMLRCTNLASSLTHFKRVVVFGTCAS
jgi:hypothetical protein